MSFGESFVTLFTDMNIIAAILLASGLVLVMIEIYRPGFGVFGISGSCALLAGVIVQLVMSDWNFLQTVILVFLILFILAIVLLIMMWLLKRGWFSRSVLVQNQTALPIDGKTKGTEDFSFLLGNEGVVKTFLRPVGKAEFEGSEYDVVAYQGAAYKVGTKIKVVEIEGQRIVVKAAE